jgi:uncharacterized membrane protein YfcA
MEFTILIILLILSTIQSIFGIGLLVLGTPIFLTLDYSFTNALSILLPTSILINFVHISKKEIIINTNLKKRLFLNCMPFIVIGCIISYNYEEKINYKFLIGLITFSLIFYKIFFLKKNYFFFSKIKNIIFQVIGLIHGISNSGGGLLSITLSALNKNNKNNTRNSIAYFYLFFAKVQYIILLIINPSLFVVSNIIYITIAALIGSYLGNKIFYKLEAKKYISALDFLIIIASMILIFSAFN